MKHGFDLRWNNCILMSIFQKLIYRERQESKNELNVTSKAVFSGYISPNFLATSITNFFGQYFKISAFISSILVESCLTLSKSVFKEHSWI